MGRPSRLLRPSGRSFQRALVKRLILQCYDGIEQLVRKIHVAIFQSSGSFLLFRRDLRIIAGPGIQLLFQSSVTLCDFNKFFAIALRHDIDFPCGLKRRGNLPLVQRELFPEQRQEFLLLLCAFLQPLGGCIKFLFQLLKKLGRNAADDFHITAGDTSPGGQGAARGGHVTAKGPDGVSWYCEAE
ncbi:hypothetical protein A6024_11240 [Rhodovulum sulfidophilum]|nr:hypothetical protein A6W98_11375 [Rhodovulum sulfidophilum DSM 1374]ANB38435.1 hypothetical protein A6024_11240 [Rhodovulum sulfidophilum]